MYTIAPRRRRGAPASVWVSRSVRRYRTSSRARAAGRSPGGRGRRARVLAGVARRTAVGSDARRVVGGNRRHDGARLAGGRTVAGETRESSRNAAAAAGWTVGWYGDCCARRRARWSPARGRPPAGSGPPACQTAGSGLVEGTRRGPSGGPRRGLPGGPTSGRNVGTTERPHATPRCSPINGLPAGPRCGRVGSPTLGARLGYQRGAAACRFGVRPGFSDGCEPTSTSLMLVRGHRAGAGRHDQIRPPPRGPGAGPRLGLARLCTSVVRCTTNAIDRGPRRRPGTRAPRASAPFHCC